MTDIRYDTDITDRNTFRMKVKTACMVEYDSVADLDYIRERLSAHRTAGSTAAGNRDTLPVPVLHIGGGSNLLFTKDFPGTILHSNIRFINILEGKSDKTGAGEAGRAGWRPEKQTGPDGSRTDSGNADNSGRDYEIRQNDGQSERCRAHGTDGANDIMVEVGAGTVFDDFCAWAAENGLWGVENLSHIPGETGAAAVQNIGAYGVEAKDVIETVNCYDMVLGKPVSFRCDECGYGYRDSLFKRDRKGRYIVTSVVFRLSRTPQPRLDYGHLRSAVMSVAGTRATQAETDAVKNSGAGNVCRAKLPMAASANAPDTLDNEAIAYGQKYDAGLTPALIREVITGIRKEKLPEPSETGSAGSFFKNPVVPKSDYDRVVAIAGLLTGKGCKVPHYDMGSGFVKIPAAWLIEQCGWKGYREGNVEVYEKQPLVIINATGKAVPDEIIALENRIVSSVREKFGIVLSPEVEHV